VSEVQVPDRPPDRVTYGPLEPTGQSYRTWQDRPTFLQALLGRHNWVSVTRERWGRKCYEVWEPRQSIVATQTGSSELVFDRGEPSPHIGRWYWVPQPREHPHGSPPLPQTCARDTLEDEMGYEQATRYIGHRDALFGFPSAD
jgi:hypothetical protein